ncbi:MAG TPA: SDR family oxidoreductase [Myxococcota bacterium]|nr:SDR family oxidoreductase [Myxococcota bacterium]
MLLENKVVMIQGVGPGLGQQLALAAAREGADVALAARTASTLDDVAAKVRRSGRRAIAVPTDIANRSQCDRFVSRTLEEFGRVDALINSAMIHYTHPFDSADLDEWRRVMDVNFYGYLNMTQAVIPAMKAGGGGAVVMVNTKEVRQPDFPGIGAYASSKGALAAATRCLAQELAPHNIRVNTAYLGIMWGPPVQGLVSDLAKERGVSPHEVKAELETKIPLGRMPEDHECAHTVLFLASDYARVVIGASFDVNGGQVLGV